ncbi:NLPA lipoprotein [Gleimia coleocanis DSM 15436]|uniref:Lipoprotein n=1 Tax=Gleimia coleocanis DSM 15436 TaxID=525245 RepID=C0W263_9ACTO|nr:MetQ/NlpA family ABC transporter substrate-binding protein [Gleimia coleocanis]EEH63277.1 NLPA lipoprotein [Gleimia coleocanis DSM 15436]
MSVKITRAQFFFAATAVAALTLSACGGTADKAAETTEGGVQVVKVAASPSPHAEILQFIDDNLAAEAGIDLEIIEYSDYVIPNEVLVSGEVDANFFQTLPYLEEQGPKLGLKGTAGKGVHLEPLGLYSAKVKDVKELKDGAVIGIIADTVNQARALRLLESEGFVELPKSGDVNIHTVKKLKNFEWREVEGAQLVRSLQDVDAAVINGNYAQEGGLSFNKDAIVGEPTENNPASNLLVWRTEDDGVEKIQKLEQLLHSDEVREFIEKTWTDGSVIPVF